MSSLGTRLRNHETLFGVFAKTNDPFFIEIIGKAGFDFVILDCEHGPNSPREMYPLMLAAQASRLHAVVRVGTLSEVEISRALDLGVAGIQIPQLTTADEAQQAVKWSKFSPEGTRGVCRFVRAADFSLRASSKYFETSNKVSVIGMVEGVAGIQNLDEILQVAGIDVLFIGPYDLSQALGLVGEVENPRVLKEIEAIVAKCKAHDRVVGTFVDNLATAKRYKDLGVQYLAYSVDVGIFADSCRKVIDDLRAL